MTYSFIKQLVELLKRREEAIAGLEKDSSPRSRYLAEIREADAQIILLANQCSIVDIGKNYKWLQDVCAREAGVIQKVIELADEFEEEEIRSIVELSALINKKGFAYILSFVFGRNKNEAAYRISESIKARDFDLAEYITRHKEFDEPERKRINELTGAIRAGDGAKARQALSGCSGIFTQAQVDVISAVLPEAAHPKPPAEIKLPPEAQKFIQMYNDGAELEKDQARHAQARREFYSEFKDRLRRLTHLLSISDAAELRRGKDIPLSFCAHREGYFLIFPIGDNQYIAVPEFNFKIHGVVYMIMKYVFEIQGYYAGYYNYGVIFPAVFRQEGNNWILKQQGKLALLKDMPSIAKKPVPTAPLPKPPTAPEAQLPSIVDIVTAYNKAMAGDFDSWEKILLESPPEPVGAGNVAARFKALQRGEAMPAASFVRRDDGPVFIFRYHETLLAVPKLRIALDQAKRKSGGLDELFQISTSVGESARYELIAPALVQESAGQFNVVKKGIIVV